MNRRPNDPLATGSNILSPHGSMLFRTESCDDLLRMAAASVLPDTAQAPPIVSVPLNDVHTDDESFNTQNIEIAHDDDDVVRLLSISCCQLCHT